MPAAAISIEVVSIIIAAQHGAHNRKSTIAELVTHSCAKGM
jgi:hypothetical protein